MPAGSASDAGSVPPGGRIAMRDPLAQFLGAIRVELRAQLQEGVTGVIASVAALITGAAAEGGFKGVAGRFERRGLLAFGAPIAADLRFTRLDTGRAVEVDVPHASPAAPELMTALRRALAPEATQAEREAFARAWQARVSDMLGAA